MKNLKAVLLIRIVAFITASFALCTKSSGQAYTYKPDDQKLFETIVQLDSLFFASYNTCNVNLEKHAAYYSDSIEFFHDKGGLANSKKEIIASIKQNVCGKVTRKLVPGSIEVYPIRDYGAVEMGLHSFSNNTDQSGTPSRVGRFMIIWQHKNDSWKITKVVSLH